MIKAFFITFFLTTIGLWSNVSYSIDFNLPCFVASQDDVSFEIKNNGKVINNTTIDLYAGEYINPVIAFKLNGIFCDDDDLSHYKLILKYNTNVRENRALVDKSGKPITSDNSVELSKDSDGNYIIPEFSYYDAASVDLVVQAPVIYVLLSKVTLERSITLRYSPYTILFDIQYDCNEGSECYNVTSLNNGEQYLSGEELNISYLAKSKCSSLKESAPYDVSDIKNCESLPSYGYDSGYVNELIIGAYSLSKKEDTTNYLVPFSVNFNQNNKNDGTGTTSTDGSTVRTSYIKDVGNFELRLNSFTDKLTGKTVYSSKYVLPKTVAPYFFDFSPLSTTSLVEIPNSCMASDGNHYSFTYFGQPISPKVMILAKNKQGEVTTLFDPRYYENISKYMLNTEAFTENKNGDYERLTYSDNFSRLVTCNNCNNSILSNSWVNGILYLNADPTEYTNVLSRVNYFVRLLAKNYTNDPSKVKSDGSVVLEGGGKLFDYRDEAPKYTGEEGKPWQRFYVFLGMNIQETNNDGSKSINRDNRPIVSSSRMIPYTYQNEFSQDIPAILFKGSPLEMRMGRIALDNARANRYSDLYVPIKTEYFRTVMSGSNVLSSGWILNNDDNCSILSKDNFYIEPFGNSKNPIYLKNSSDIKFDDNAISHKVELVNDKSSSDTTDSVVSAKNGVWYLKISKPIGDSSQVFFTLRDLSVGSWYDIKKIVDTSNVTPIRDTKDLISSDARYSNPAWLGTTLEGIDQCFAAFRSWPGSNRILYRIENIQ